MKMLNGILKGIGFLLGQKSFYATSIRMNLLKNSRIKYLAVEDKK